MKDRAVKYEYYIDRIVTENQIKLDELLLKKNGESITVKDFVEKTKEMQPWHRRLLSNLTEVQETHGDIRGYMRRYIDEKVSDGFRFKRQEKKEKESS